MLVKISNEMIHDCCPFYCLVVSQNPQSLKPVSVDPAVPAQESADEDSEDAMSWHSEAETSEDEIIIELDDSDSD